MKGILTDESGDLAVRRGALAIGNCDADIAERLIRAWQGEFKEAPLLGGNIERMIGGTPDPFWRGDIRMQLESQHIGVQRLDMVETGIELEIVNSE
jgi:hypothetical protein